jgi:hypothetical protein
MLKATATTGIRAVNMKNMQAVVECDCSNATLNSFVFATLFCVCLSDKHEEKQSK